MLKYYNSMITFSEVPDEISLCINISNCPIRCPDCHSKFLWDDVGLNITNELIRDLITKNKDVTCICLMGGDSSLEDVYQIFSFIKYEYPQYKLCWYSGRNIRPSDIKTKLSRILDYIKLGPYIKEYGGLNNPNTNQRFYKVEHKNDGKFKTSLFFDITKRFYENKNIYKEDRQDNNSSSNN